MNRLYHIAPGTDALALLERARLENVLLFPGFRWSHRFIVVHVAAPLFWLGACPLIRL